jgi:hypothetical protein
MLGGDGWQGTSRGKVRMCEGGGGYGEGWEEVIQAEISQWWKVLT